MKLAVVGSRTLNHESYRVTVYKLIDAHGQDLTEIVSGGAKGIDTFAADYARERGMLLTEFLPDWEQFGRSAGYRRNVQIVTYADQVLALWDGTSRGTQHSVNLAREYNRPCYVYHIQRSLSPLRKDRKYAHDYDPPSGCSSGNR